MKIPTVMNKFVCWFIFFLLYGCDYSSPIRRQLVIIEKEVQEQRYQSAIKKYESLLERNLSNDIKLRILYQVAEIYNNYLFDDKNAINYYLKVVAISDNPRWQVNAFTKLADTYFFNSKRYSDAAQFYQRLVAFRPKLEQYDYFEFQLASAMMYMGDTQGAKLKFLEIMKNTAHPYFPKATQRYGMCFYLEKDWKNAIYYWNNYIEKFSQSASTVDDQRSLIEIKYLLANAYETAEELEKAYEIYYSIKDLHEHPASIKARLESVYNRRLARKR